MIGGWVYASKDEHTVLKVMTINGNTADCIWDVNNECDMNIDEFQPIPLTPEILEKNGFKNISDHTLKGSDTFRLRVEQRGFDYTITIKLRDYFRLDSYDDRVYTLCEIDFGLNYVHELQRALKLCGIEKTIEL